jgi:thioredoxin 1
MSDASDSEDFEEVREKKLAELRARAGENDAEAPKETTAADEPIHLEAGDDFAAIVPEHDVVLVDFHADWCGPCKMLEPIVESLAETTAATVLKVDVDAHQGLAGEYGVRGVPTLLLMVDGEVAERVVGVQEENRLRTLIEQHAG